MAPATSPKAKDAVAIKDPSSNTCSENHGNKYINIDKDNEDSNQDRKMVENVQEPNPMIKKQQNVNISEIFQQKRDQQKQENKVKNIFMK